MLEAIQGALRISDLWLMHGDVPDEHIEEGKALYIMFQWFKDVSEKAAHILNKYESS